MTYNNMRIVKIRKGKGHGKGAQFGVATLYSFERVWKSRGWEIVEEEQPSEQVTLFPSAPQVDDEPGDLPPVDDGNDTKAEQAADKKKKEGAK